MTTEEAPWYEAVMNSADIEEMLWRFTKAEKDTTTPIKIELYFDHDKAVEFIQTTMRRSPDSTRDLLSFCRYLAQVVDYKLREANGE